MDTKVEVIYFIKPCPHCKEMLFRVEEMSMAWSECRNVNCVFLARHPLTETWVHSIVVPRDPKPYTECYNRR